MNKIFSLLVILAGLGLFLTGCSNTMDGMGRDVEKAGQTIQDTF